MIVREGAQDSPHFNVLEEMPAGGVDRARDLKVLDVAHVSPPSWCKRRVEVVVGRSAVDNYPDHNPYERKGASVISAGVATNALKNSEGKR